MNVTEKQTTSRSDVVELAVQYLRYAYDHLWASLGRDDVFSQFDPVTYQQALDYLLLKTFNTLGLDKHSCGVFPHFEPNLSPSAEGSEKSCNFNLGNWYYFDKKEDFDLFDVELRGKDKISWNIPPTFPCFVFNIIVNKEIIYTYITGEQLISLQKEQKGVYC